MENKESNIIIVTMKYIKVIVKGGENYVLFYIV